MKRYLLPLFFLGWHLAPAQQVRMVYDLHPNGNGTPTFALPLGDLVVFGGQDGVHGRELFITDGTAEGTRLLRDLHPDNPSGNALIGPLLAWDKHFYFAAHNGVQGRELWRSDGTTEGTLLLAEFHPDGDGLALSQTPPLLGDAFYLMVQTAPQLLQLARCDGETAEILPLTGASLIAAAGLYPLEQQLFLFQQAAPGALALLGLQAQGDWTVAGYWSNPTDLQPRFHGRLDSLVFFSVLLPDTGRELWISSGDADDAQLLLDIHPSGNGVETATRMHRVPGSPLLVFAGRDADHGSELWVTDGSTGGTVLLRDIHPGPASFADLLHQPLLPFQDKLFFAARDSIHGQELWVTDGSTGGTVLLRDIHPGGDGLPQALNPGLVVGGLLFFAADDGVNGTELWVTDGTAAGTRMVHDIHPDGSSQPSTFLNFRDRLWFTADDGIHGRELWTSDGTAEGTYLVADIHPSGTANVVFLLAQPEYGRLFFRADDGVHGFELWVLEDSPSAVVEDAALPNWLFYPNPARDQLFLSLEEAVQLDILHLSGRLIRQMRYQPGQPVDVSGLPAGAYLLRPGGRPARLFLIQP